MRAANERDHVDRKCDHPGRSRKKLNPQLAWVTRIFMREPSGRAIRVEPTREFRTGDRIRIALEPNTDGYLYIFNSENGAAPKMIFPDARLDGGENWIEAHVPDRSAIKRRSGRALALV